MNNQSKKNCNNDKFSSHEIIDFKIKPSDKEVFNLIDSYFSSQADDYDLFDKKVTKRNNYNQKINSLVINELNNNSASRVLSIACGTGRREIEISNAVLNKVEITGVDRNSKMCQLARNRGLSCKEGTIFSCFDSNDREVYDAVIYLHAFGHIPSGQARKMELNWIFKHLSPNGFICLDVMNLNDQNEWGETIKKYHRDRNWSEKGYELGDIFYRRLESDKTSFFHYFEKDELDKLLRSVGFEEIKYYFIGYAISAGEIVEEDAGAIFICAFKKDKNE